MFQPWGKTFRYAELFSVCIVASSCIVMPGVCTCATNTGRQYVARPSGRGERLCLTTRAEKGSERRCQQIMFHSSSVMGIRFRRDCYRVAGDHTLTQIVECIAVFAVRWMQSVPSWCFARLFTRLCLCCRGFTATSILKVKRLGVQVPCHRVRRGGNPSKPSSARKCSRNLPSLSQRYG